MSENSLKETVTRLATPLVQAQGLEIWGVEIAQAGRTTVRVFVDLPLEVKQAQAALSADSDPADNLEDSADIMTARSASIDQCEEISRQLGLALEVEDLIEQAYVLEVSTPGFSRLFFSLDQMRSYVGDMVELRMVSAYAPENAPAARRAWRGVLREVTDSGPGQRLGRGRHLPRGHGRGPGALGHGAPRQPHPYFPPAAEARQAARPQGRQGRAPGRRPQEGQGQERQEQASRPQRGRRHITARARPAVLSRGRKAASSSPARNGGFRPRPVHQEIYAALCGSRR